jgi:hypothetical protein
MYCTQHQRFPALRPGRQVYNQLDQFTGCVPSALNASTRLFPHISTHMGAQYIIPQLFGRAATSPRRTIPRAVKAQVGWQVPPTEKRQCVTED